MTMSTRKSQRPVHHGLHFAGRHVDLDDGDAFVPDYRRGFVAFDDDEAEALGEEFINAATSAEAVGESARNEIADDELGGLTVELLDDASEA
jgi:hypothetical protein